MNPRVFVAACRETALKLLGYVGEGELRALYEHAAAFVHPSLYEGFGLPPLEAMALHCPVIASNAAAIPETCGDAALYFEPQRAEQLAQLIERVVSEPALRDELVARATVRWTPRLGGGSGRHLAWCGGASCMPTSGVLAAPSEPKNLTLADSQSRLSNLTGLQTHEALRERSAPYTRAIR